MSIWNNILNSIGGKVKIFLSFALIFFLSSCGECETVQGYLQEGTGENCFFCPLYITLTDAGTAAATTSWRIVASAAQPVVCVVIAIYIACYTLKMVASMGQQSYADYLSADKKGILQLSFKAAVIVLLLNPDNFMTTTIIAPLLQTAAGVGIELASSMVSDINIPSPSITSTSDPWKDLFGLMNNIARGFNDVAYLIVAIGKALICNSTDGFIFGWEFTMLLYGLIVLVFGWMVCIGVCYFLVDVIINLICASVLLPLAIALAISDKTQNHSKNIWNMFVNSFCSCLFLGTVLALAITIIDVNMGGNAISKLSNSNNVSDNAISELSDSNNVSALATYLNETGGLLLMIISLTLLVKVIESIKQLANELSSVSGIVSGSKALTPVTKKAMGEGMRLAKGVANAGVQVTKNTGHAFVRLTHLDELATWGKNRVNARIGFLTGAGPQGYKAFWRPAGRALARKTMGRIKRFFGF